MVKKYEHVEQAMVDYWGKRCNDFERSCAKCKAWNQFDKMSGVIRK